MNVKVNKGLFSYVLLCFFLLLNDYIEYIAKIDYKSSLIFSGIITFVLWRKFISKHFDIVNIKINKFDAAAILIILLLGLLRIAIPDASNDTLNYHIYFQQFLGRDFVNHDFFPNRVMNEVSLFFADRMFNLFRYFLGFRMGTVLNIFVSVLFYIQLKDFTKSILDSMKLDFQVKNFAIALIALSGILNINFLLDFNIYYVDLLALPLILECIRIVIFDEESNGYKKGFLAFMAGVCVSLKMSNAFFLIPLAIAYIFKYRKSINVKSIIFSVLAALFTVALYMYISWKLTKNPMFPYLNSVFKSPFFATNVSPNTLSDFYAYFGAKSVLQFIFWPVYIIINPEVCANAGYYIGYILQCFIIIFIAFLTRQKYGRKILYVNIIWIIYYFIYLIAINGFNRYAIIMDSLSAVIIGIYCYAWIKGKKGKKGALLKGVSCITILSIVISIGIVFNNVNIRNINRPGSKSLLTDIDLHKENAKLLFKDYDSGIDNEFLKNIDYWYISEFNSGYAGLIKPEIPMIISHYGITNETSQEIYNKNLQSMKGKNIYTISKGITIKGTIKRLNENNFVIKDVKALKCNFYDATKALMFMKIEHNDAGYDIENVYNLRNSSDDEIDLSDYKNIGYESEFFIGPDTTMTGCGNNGFSVKAELVSDKGSKELFNSKWIPQNSYLKENVSIPKEEININSKIKFTVYNNGKQNYDENWVTVIEQSHIY